MQTQQKHVTLSSRPPRRKLLKHQSLDYHGTCRLRRWWLLTPTCRWTDINIPTHGIDVIP